MSTIRANTVTDAAGTGSPNFPNGLSVASPALTGTPTAPTATAADSTTQIATTAFVTTADNLKANLASPALTGIPTAPTAAVATDTTQIATTAFVNAEISGDVGVANSSLVMTALNAGGSAPIYACRSWVNFNGSGTVAIRASGNVSSITDNGVGDYTVNFTTAMTDANYAALVSPFHNAGADVSTTRRRAAEVYSPSGYNITTSSVRVGTWYESGSFNAPYDATGVFVSIFR